VLSGPDRRRRWTFAEKLRMVEECLAPEAIVAEVARRATFMPTTSCMAAPSTPAPLDLWAPGGGS